MFGFELYRPHDNTHSFHGDNLYGRALFNERAFGHYIDTFTFDHGSAGWAQGRQRRAGLVEQFRFFRADVSDGSLRNKQPGEPAVGKEFKPAKSAGNQA